MSKYVSKYGMMDVISAPTYLHPLQDIKV